MPRTLAALAVALLLLCATRAARAQPSCATDDGVKRERAAAFDARDAIAALRATSTYLEAVNRLGQTQPGCYDTLATDAPKLRELYCREGSAHRESDVCILLDKIQLDILRLAAQRSIEAADKAEGEQAKVLYVEAANRFLDAYRGHCEGGPRHVEPRMCEEVGYNAARAFTAAHLTAKAIGAYRLLIVEDERSKRRSPLVARAMYDLGLAYRSMAMFDEAAEQLESVAALQPATDKAPAALSDAALLRMALGHDAQAASDVAMFTRNWGITRRAEAAQLALTLATHHAEHGEKDKARAVVAGAMSMLVRGPPDLVVRGHALAAKVATSQGAANHEWAKVRQAWSDPVAAERAIRRGWPMEDEAQGDRRLARALNAVGESMVAAAEEVRLAEVEPLKLVLSVGPADRAALLRYSNTTLRDFVAKKRSAIERAEAAYVAVLQLRPMPAPLSVIASSAAVGAMWGDFVDELRRISLASPWRADPSLHHAFVEAMESATEPIRQTRAKPAMKACIALAVKFEVYDPSAERCSAWLASHYGGRGQVAEHHRIDELVPSLRTTRVVDDHPRVAPLRGLVPMPDP